MKSKRLFPYTFRVEVAQLLKDEFRHVELTAIFSEAGFDGDTHEQISKEKRVLAVLDACNDLPEEEALQIAGYMIAQYISKGRLRDEDQWSTASPEALLEIVSRHGFQFDEQRGLRSQLHSPATASLATLLEERNYSSVEDEFARAVKSIEDDPPAALLAACAILEAVLKTFIDDADALDGEDFEDIRKMWKKVRDHLGLDPRSKEDKHVKAILQSMGGLVDGIAKLRSDVSNAHGKGRLRYRVSPRHARLAVNAAHTMTTFLIETWEEQRNAQD